MTTPAIHAAIDEDTARARRADPDTSHAAADGISATAREASEIEVVAILESFSSPVTADTIVTRHIQRVWNAGTGQQWTDSRIRTALAQLVRKGVVVQAGERKNPSGYRARAWRLATPDER